MSFFGGKMKELFKSLTKFEKALWITSVVVVFSAYIVSGGGDVLTGLASVIGVTALIFVAKGYVIGQVLTVVFAVFYGVISFSFRYYGEMITYLGMTFPMAILATVSWIRNPYKKTKEVKVKKMSTTESAVMLTFSAAVTVLFYFILKALGNESLTVSTFSVTISFIASYLTFMRSPYYALAYAANDVVLIVLWIIASLTDTSYVTMAVCFFMFLLNDLYGFINWRRMMKRQNDS